jgi:hypothetical protein
MAWLSVEQKLLRSPEMKVKPVQLWQDNRSTICLARRGKSTSDRTRHVAIRYFFIKDRKDSGEVEISCLPTKRIVADFFQRTSPRGCFPAAQSDGDEPVQF